MIVDVLVLNYNGADLLGECLPSVLRAAAASRHECRVAVIDNASTDSSKAMLQAQFPQVKLYVCANRGLCSFNEVLPRLTGSVAVLLNNDIKLAPDCLDDLIEPLLQCQQKRRCFLTAPLCWRFDGCTYDGQKTAIRWHWGVVQATWQFPGHERGIHKSGWTASAGAALAVDRRVFLELGGFDPLYLPGRLEDLDLAYRGYQAGYYAQYVSSAIAYHQSQATFSRVFGKSQCDRLTLRNTLLFQWKHLRHPWHVLRQITGGLARLLRDAALAPVRPAGDRFVYWRALRDAISHWRVRPALAASRSIPSTELEFFRRFHPRSLTRSR